MKRLSAVILLVWLLLLADGSRGRVTQVPEFLDLFNGRDLAGWVNVNTADETWRVRDGVLICSGHPIGVMRTERQYGELHLAHRMDAYRTGREFWSVRLEQRPPESKQPAP